jgi:outer membrane protein W
MKKVLVFSFACLLAASAAVAQIKPVTGDWGLGFKLDGINSTSITHWNGNGTQIFGRYYFTDKVAMRLGFGINTYNSKIESTEDVKDANQVTIGTRTADSKTTQFGFGIMPGVEYHMGSAASKLDPYVGAEIMLNSLGKMKMTYDSTESISQSGNSSNYTQNMTMEKGGSFTFGINALVGFNYFFSDNFAIGAEYKWGFTSKTSGGDFSTTGTTSTSINGNTTNTVINQTGSMKNSAGNLNVAGMGGLNLNVYF